METFVVAFPVSRNGKATMDLPMLEMSCPEFFATHIGRVEPAGGDCVRIYFCVLKNGVLEPVYTRIAPLILLPDNSRTLMTVASRMRTGVPAH